MRGAPARRKRKLSPGELIRPAATILCVLLAARLAMEVIPPSGGYIGALWGEKGAVTALRLSIGGAPAEFFSIESLMNASSSLLSAYGGTPGGGPAAAPVPESPPPSPENPTPSAETYSPAVISPSPLDTFGPTPYAPPSPSASENPEASLLDDRVWPTPSPDDPSARRLREVTLLPSSAETTISGGEVYINNDTGYKLDIPAMLGQKPALKKSAEGPQVLIIHTHGSESFLPDERDMYVPTDIERTEDTRYNVVRLGDEMEKLLTEMGLTVLHDREIHDYPTYAGSYSRSLSSIQNYVKEYPSIQMVIDIHRDAISSSDGTMYKTVAETELGKAAQMMFVMGSNKNGLPFDGWRNNLTFAVHLQKLIVENCPTLMRPIHLRTDRFNQHATNGSMLLEVGTAGNSLTEALLSVQLFCKYTGPYLVETLLP